MAARYAPYAMGGGEAVRIVAGIGFRSETAASEIVALVERALEEAHFARNALIALASAESLASRPAFSEAARMLDVISSAIDQETLVAQTGLNTSSARSMAAHGVGSVAEAASLAAAGPGARLVLPRIASRSVTCALAKRRDEVR